MIINEWSGFLICIEGIDGTGKSTLAKSLSKKLVSQGYDVVHSFEPTNGPHGKKIRENAVAHVDMTADEQLDLFVKDRKDHLKDLIIPSLKDGKIVILDRYFYSTIAYQGAAGYDVDKIYEIHEDFAVEPDLLCILDLDVDKALERIKKNRGGELDFFEKKDYLKKVAEIFKNDIRCKSDVVRLYADANPEDLLNDFLSIVERSLNLDGKE